MKAARMTFNTKTFEASLKQGILVVTPNGDSLSYRDVDIHREGIELKDYIQQEKIQHVVVDLGRSNYFSSLMLGVINSLGQSALRNGGRMLLCNASEEMQTVLRIMKLDMLWPVVPTLAEALKAVKG